MNVLLIWGEYPLFEVKKIQGKQVRPLLPEGEWSRSFWKDSSKGFAFSEMKDQNDTWKYLSISLQTYSSITAMVN